MEATQCIPVSPRQLWQVRSFGQAEGNPKGSCSSPSSAVTAATARTTCTGSGPNGGTPVRPGSLADAMTRRQLAGKQARLPASRRYGHVAGEKWVHDGDVPAGTAVIIEDSDNAGSQGILVSARTVDGITLAGPRLQDLDTQTLVDDGRGHSLRELFS